MTAPLDRGLLANWLDELLACWRAAADQPNGLFYPSLDRAWHRRPDTQCTLVSQGRLSYNFARAAERGLPGYPELVERGVDALLRHFRRGDDQPWAWSCGPDGTRRDDGGDAYGQAFVVLALSTAAAVVGRDDWRDEALRTWQVTKRAFGDEHGGLVWHLTAAGDPVDELRSQNPLMHTFEALLALAPLDPTGAVRDDAAALWRFLAARRVAPGVLPEWYEQDWTPRPDGPRSGVDLGHQFEWAFLLSEAAALGLGDELLDEGRAHLACGLRHGLDPATGGVRAVAAFDGTPRDEQLGWWQQCEGARALCRYLRAHGAEVGEPFARLMGFIRDRYVDFEHGGFYSALPDPARPASFDKGSPWKLDYHVVNAALECLR